MTQRKDPELNLQIGRRIRLLRDSMGVTQTELAGFIGMNPKCFAAVELGTKGITLKTLCRLAQALYTTTDYLLTGESPFQDPTSMEARLSVMEPPVLQGAEELVRSYLKVVDAFKTEGGPLQKY